MGDPILGTWKLNIAKSKFDPGPPPMSKTDVFEVWDTDGVQETVTMVLADGTRLTVGFAAHYDGKDNNVTGYPDFDTLALKRVDQNTLAFTLKNGGKVVGAGSSVVSENGRIRTDTTTLTNAEGQKGTNVWVYDRQ
jgi:hypothetical protein